MSPKLRVTQLALALVGLVAAPFNALGGDSSPSHFQARNVYLFNPTGLVTLVPGAATLTRTRDGISFGMYTSGLAPGVHTIWIVIFNRPENCAGGPEKCLGSDLANPAVEGSVVAGPANIVGLDGIANFFGSLREGTPPEGIQVNVPGGTVDGLKNSRKAVIHLVIRAHGAVSSMGNAVIQLSTFETCGACVNVQTAAFEAVK